MYELNTTGRLFAEIVALRLVTQRLLAQFAAAGGNMDAVLRHEHQAVLGDLNRMQINDVDPQRAQAIRDHAERVLDEMHTVMRQGSPPS